MTHVSIHTRKIPAESQRLIGTGAQLRDNPEEREKFGKSVKKPINRPIALALARILLVPLPVAWSCVRVRATCSCECSRLSHTGCCSIAFGLPNRNHRMKQAKGVGLRQSSPAGCASRSLGGNKAKKVVFNGSPSEYSGLQSAKPGLFSAGEPASVFTGTTGVVAGTDVELAQHLHHPIPPPPPATQECPESATWVRRRRAARRCTAGPSPAAPAAHPDRVAGNRRALPPGTAGRAPAGEEGASVVVTRRAPRVPPSRPWQNSDPLRYGACSLPGPLRRSSVHTAIKHGGVAAAFERLPSRCQHHWSDIIKSINTKGDSQTGALLR